MTATYKTYNQGDGTSITIRQLITADDVDESILKLAEDCLDCWFSGVERIDWEDFIDRLEKSHLPDDIEIPDYDNAAVRKIQRHIRQIRA